MGEPPLPGRAPPARAAASQTWALSQRILADVAGCRDSRNRPLAVSIGISELKPTTDAEGDGLLASADAALYRAKAAGGGHAVIARPVRYDIEAHRHGRAAVTAVIACIFEEMGVT